MKIALIAILAALSVSCSTGPTANTNVQNTAAVPVPSRTADGPVTPVTSPAAAPADEAGTESPADFQGTAGNTLKENPAAAGAVMLREVRSAAHPNYDRVVFEFEGSQLPSYNI